MINNISGLMNIRAFEPHYAVNKAASGNKITVSRNARKQYHKLR